MSKRLDETLGTVGYDNLINGLYPPAEPFSVVIRKGSAETTYKRGTVPVSYTHQTLPTKRIE